MTKRLICFIISLSMVFSLIPHIAFAAETDGGTGSIITGFAGLSNSEFYYEGNPSEEELTMNLPETIEVYLDDSDTPTDISVSWQTVEDFENTDFYFYSMKPVWSDEYILSDSLSDFIDVPWITVYKQEPDNDIIEPMVTEDEVQPVYTEETGPVNPETSSIGDFTANIVNIATGAFAEEVYAAGTNTDKIYAYLTNTMGLNRAAACGVMTNINAESAMSPINLQNTYNSSFGLSDQEYTDRVNAGKGAYKTKNGTSKNFKTDYAGYGLCQWTSNGRKANLLNCAVSNKVSIGDINNQLAFLNTELQSSYSQVYNTLRNVPDTAAGAYIAAVEFCMCFEIPANTVATAASRGKACLSNYWPKYSGSSASTTGQSFISLCGYSYPKSIKKGSGMTVRGYALSNYAIKNISGKILNSSGKTVYSKSVSVNSTACSLSSLDDAMKFSKLSSGNYTYVVAAKDSKGKTVQAVHKFSVSSSVSTVSDCGFEDGFVPITTATSTSEENTGSSQSGTTENTDSTQTVTETKKTLVGYSGAFPKLPKRGYFRKGDKGTQVKNLQKLLRWCGYKVTAGGTYGSKTVAAVKKVQKKYGYTVNGRLGPKALAKLKATKKSVTVQASSSTSTVKKSFTGAVPKIPKRGYFRKGDKGTQVKNLQKLLRWCGYNVTTGGTYGSKTVAEVKKVQKKYGYTVNGRLGPKALAKLLTVKK